MFLTNLLKLRMFLIIKVAAIMKTVLHFKFPLFTLIAIDLAIFFISPILSFSTTFSFTHSYSSQVLEVLDGDTVTLVLADGHQTLKCRIYGIDAPETPKYSKKGNLIVEGQPFSLEATAYLKALLQNKEVHVFLTGDKSFDRFICKLFIGDKDVGNDLIQKGFAWPYHRFIKREDREFYIESYRYAKFYKLNIWSDTNPEPPWEFRKRIKRKH